jgi:hypothetical protein
MAMDAEERGELALDLYRARHNGTVGSVGTLRRAQGTLGDTLTGARSKITPTHPPALSKSPPRPSPASVAYHSDEESLKDYDENPDDSSVTEKPSEISSSESQVCRNPTVFNVFQKMCVFVPVIKQNFSSFHASSCRRLNGLLLFSLKI